jgi:hypothetical protein
MWKVRRTTVKRSYPLRKKGLQYFWLTTGVNSISPLLVESCSVIGGVRLFWRVAPHVFSTMPLTHVLLVGLNTFFGRKKHPKGGGGCGASAFGYSLTGSRLLDEEFSSRSPWLTFVCFYAGLKARQWLWLYAPVLFSALKLNSASECSDSSLCNRMECYSETSVGTKQPDCTQTCHLK